MSAPSIPLSFNQEFLCMFDQGDEEGPFGPRYNIVLGWRLYGKIDTDTLRQALNEAVVRHEGLRTTIVRTAGGQRQEIAAPGPVDLDIRELPGIDPADRDRRAEELVIAVEGEPHGVTRLPLLHAVLGRFDEEESVLVLTVHHTAADEISMQLIMRDVADLYAVRRGHPSRLPETAQFQEYAVWERERFGEGSPAAAKARAYWAQQLDGGMITGIPTDHPKSAGLPKTTAVHRFLLDEDLTTATLELARATRSTAFMVTLAAYQLLVRELTGASDITVPTMASGRGPARFQNTVGAFFNFVPLRTRLAGAATFREVVERTRATCFKAYAHDLPFGQVVGAAPGVVAAFGADDLGVFAFQAFQFPAPHREPAGDIEYSEIRTRLISQEVSTDIPDGAMIQLAHDPATGRFSGYLGYNTNIYAHATMRAMAVRYQEILRAVVADPDGPLPA